MMNTIRHRMTIVYALLLAVVMLPGCKEKHFEDRLFPYEDGTVNVRLTEKWGILRGPVSYSRRSLRSTIEREGIEFKKLRILLEGRYDEELLQALKHEFSDVEIRTEVIEFRQVQQ